MRGKYCFNNKTKESSLADRAEIATTFVARLTGLLRTSSLESGQGLFLKPCNSIHMFWMRYPIDAVFLDKQGQVVATLENFKPWSLSPVFARAHGCLELPAGTIARTRTEKGDQIEWAENGAFE